MRGLRFWFLVLSAGGLLLSLRPDRAAAAPAMETAAVLAKLMGSGYLDPGRRPLVNGLVLKRNERLILRSGKCSLKLADGTTVALSGPAELAIEVVRDAAGRCVIQMPSGRAFVRTRQNPGGEVRVNTPSATLAVRGSAGGTDASADASLCWCAEGMVFIEGGGEQIWLTPGSQSLVRLGQGPGTPTPLDDETQGLNEDLNLDASTNLSPGLTNTVGGGGTGTGGQRTGLGLAPAGAPSPDRVAQEHIRAAVEVLTGLYDAYEHEDLSGVSSRLAAGFSTSGNSGLNRNGANIEESVRQDFLNLDNIRFLRQPGASRRFYSETDQVSIRERWLVNAVMPGGARFEQGGETVFVLGADAGGGGIRVLRWEGDPPFGRSDPVQDRITVTSATHFTPAAAGAPQVLLSQGTLSAGGTEITDANARLVSGGVAIEASEVSITPQGGLNLGGANLVINGAGVAATGVSVPSGTGFTATGVSLNVGGAEVQAGRLVVENGTVLLENLVVTDSHGNTATLVTGTIQPGENGGRPVVTGTTADGQTVVVDAGELEYDYPPDAPLPAGRGERLADGQGLNFATGAVVQGRADLFFSSGRVEADGGLRDMGAVPFATVRQAPADGYGTNPLPVQDLINHVLVAQLANDRYAKILVRAGTTEAQLYFDWVYNPSQSNVLSRGRRYPTRAKISYEAKLYNRDASGDTMLQSGVENMAEVRVDSTRLFSNGASLEAHLAPRISTDRQVDGQTMVMDRVGITYFRPNDFEISLGDLSGEFTRYTLYQSLAGLRAWRNFSMGPAGAARLTAITGPRWRSGAGFNADGWVTGLRLSTDDVRDLGPLLEDLVVGANLVRSYTGKSNRLSSTVLSFDAAARLKGGLGLLGEWAVSRARQGGQESHGEARLLRAAYRWGALRLVMDRERVSPGFRTVSGSATTDQERTNLWVRLRPNDWSSLNLNFLHTRDNLGGSKAYTTRMDVPRLGISVSPFYPILDRGFLRNLTVDLLLSETDRDSDDAGHTINRMSRMLSLSLIQRMGDLYLTLGHDNSRDLDYAASGTSRRGNALDLSLRWRPRYALLGIPMSPIVGVRRGRDNYTGPNGPVSGKISSQRVGLDIGDESILGVELGYELLDNERTDLGGYNRRILNVDLNRILDGEGTRTVGLSYRLLTNDQESGARSYTEGQLTGSVSQRF